MIFLLSVLTRAEEPPPQPPPTSPGIEAFREKDRIPREILSEIYQLELGKRYKPQLDDKLFEAHTLIEKYFSTPSTKDRQKVAKEIEAVSLAADQVGRLIRLRMDWPALEGGSVFYVNEMFGPHRVKYFVGVPPEYDRTRPWLLVIKLPAEHAFLTQPPQNAEQVAKIYSDWIVDELRHHPDAAVLMPLLNLDELYGPSYNGMNTVIQPIRHVYEKLNIDPARIYLTGHAMAGHAVWNLGLHYTTYFAAINPLAGAATGDWQRLRLMNLRNVLPVVWHDTDDTVLKVDKSRQIVKALRTLKLDVEYDETKGVGHAPNAEVTERVYEKTTARVRELYPPEVLLQSNRPETMFNRLDWVQVYQPINAGKDRRLLFRHGTGYMVVNQNALSVAAKRTKNRLDVTSKNVQTLRIYYNDQMADFREPVTITVNKKVRFEGLLKPSVEEMLKDQLVLGRGWRYYTAIVDIDLAPSSTTQPAAPKEKENAKTPEREEKRGD